MAVSVAYCATHGTTGSSQEIWDGFQAMETRAAGMADCLTAKRRGCA